MKPKIVLITGFGRSGSSLINMLISKRINSVDVGELRFLYERGYINNERCSCNDYFRECNFWDGVIKKIPVDDPFEYSLLSKKTQRNRSFFTSYFNWFSEDDEKYIGKEKKLIDSILNNSSSRHVILDSSKVPVRACLYYKLREHYDVKILHVLRDPRAVSYSWSKDVPRPETDNKENMHKFSYLESSLLWVGVNFLSRLLSFKYKDDYKMIIYEDLCKNPVSVMDSVESFIFPGGNDSLNNSVFHSISGNPMRFVDNVDIKLDENWKKNTTKFKNIIPSVIALPYYYYIKVKN
ncbi:sulfotransferase domain-containing protein [Vibrio pomeroyi]|uniref:sulfotransferase domain-containing protein n=1 Tax=Vibrio pomeroyi TaxID=198832 RepID=UPI0021C2E71A|nr:sulfotransferase domain-containing protein [Vibrio pomeroyi]